MSKCVFSSPWPLKWISICFFKENSCLLRLIGNAYSTRLSIDCSSTCLSVFTQFEDSARYLSVWFLSQALLTEVRDKKIKESEMAKALDSGLQMLSCFWSCSWARTKRALDWKSGGPRLQNQCPDSRLAMSLIHPGALLSLSIGWGLKTSWPQGPACSGPGWFPSLPGCSMQRRTCWEWGNPPSGPWAGCSRELCQCPCLRGYSQTLASLSLDHSPWQPQILYLRHPKQPPWFTTEKPCGGSGRKSTLPESSNGAIKLISPENQRLGVILFFHSLSQISVVIRMFSGFGIITNKKCQKIFG